MLATSATAFFVGRGAVKAVLTGLLLVGGVWELVRVGRREPWLLVIPAVLGVGMASFLVGREATGAGFYSRYMLAYLPLYLAVLVLGLRGAAEGLAARRVGWSCWRWSMPRPPGGARSSRANQHPIKIYTTGSMPTCRAARS